MVHIQLFYLAIISLAIISFSIRGWLNYTITDYKKKVPETVSNGQSSSICLMGSVRKCVKHLDQSFTRLKKNVTMVLQ